MSWFKPGPINCTVCGACNLEAVAQLAKGLEGASTLEEYTVDVIVSRKLGYDWYFVYDVSIFKVAVRKGRAWIAKGFLCLWRIMKRNEEDNHVPRHFI